MLQPETAQASSGIGRQVLVVDDDHAVRSLVTDLLEQAGCRVSVASDGVEALEHLARSRADAMVLDIQMPRLDGFGVLSRMNELDPGQRARTLVLTARGQREDVAEALRLGARDYLAKPFQKQQLVLRVARLLIRSRAALDAVHASQKPD